MAAEHLDRNRLPRRNFGDALQHAVHAHRGDVVDRQHHVAGAQARRERGTLGNHLTHHDPARHREPEIARELVRELLRHESEVAALDALARHQAREHPLDDRGGDGKTDADEPLREVRREDGGVDADQAPFEVDEGAARIPLIDGGVRLDEVLVVVEPEPVAPERRNDPGRHRLPHVEGGADRKDGRAHAQRGAVTHGDRGEPRRVDAQEREVRFGVGADDPGGVGLAVGESDLRV